MNSSWVRWPSTWLSKRNDALRFEEGRPGGNRTRMPGLEARLVPSGNSRLDTSAEEKAQMTHAVAFVTVRTWSRPLVSELVSSASTRRTCGLGTRLGCRLPCALWHVQCSRRGLLGLGQKTALRTA